ncbi:glycoside hydrolase domain-containing protein, partial [Streptomyces sp. URMC 124]|uniref:glycoside hydrolase domain-containing protein n=1 Tax=Streptomyces sp. URMC 124 TaxID=3423405 RepID=UPI003F192C15
RPSSPSGAPASPVTYRGLTFDLPANWNVVNLDEHPDTCVRLDRHTLYLGHPGSGQDCPTHLVTAKTEAVVLEPFDGAVPRTGMPLVDVPAGHQVPGALPTDDEHEVRVAFDGAGLLATAAYEDSPDAVRNVLATARTGPSATPGALHEPSSPALSAQAAAATPSTGFTGKAFDACTAPSASAMAAWARSPYRGVGIYIGGPSIGCPHQPNLTPSWVQERTKAGWHMLPIYAGTQAKRISSRTAEQDGRAAADKAVALAKDLGFVPGTVLYDDMEAYGDDSAYHARVLSYLSGWSARVRELGFRAGVYSSAGAAIQQLAGVYRSRTHALPDVIWTAAWNHKADLSDGYTPDGYWADHQRVHQYEANVLETYGGTTIKIDRNYMDVAAAPTVQDPGMTELTAGDFTHDGRKDLVAVQVSTGKLFLYPGTRKSGLDTFGDRVEIGSGAWNGMRNLTVGDFTGDGKPDLVATKTETGQLFLYPGTDGKGLATLDDRVEIGTGGWNGMKHLAAGDFNGDGRADLVAARTESGQLFLYPGTHKPGPATLADRVEIGTGGWNGMNKVVSPGDFNGDGKDDLIATKTDTGELFLYPGTAKAGLDALGERVVIGTGGWNGISDYAAADFTGDRRGDVVAVSSDPGRTGKLYLYRGNGKGLDARVEIGTGGW